MMEGFMAKFGDVRIERYAKRVAEEAERQVKRKARDEGDASKDVRTEEGKEGQ